MIQYYKSESNVSQIDSAKCVCVCSPYFCILATGQIYYWGWSEEGDWASVCVCVRAWTRSFFFFSLKKEGRAKSKGIKENRERAGRPTLDRAWLELIYTRDHHNTPHQTYFETPPPKYTPTDWLIFRSHRSIDTSWSVLITANHTDHLAPRKQNLKTKQRFTTNEAWKCEQKYLEITLTKIDWLSQLGDHWVGQAGERKVGSMAATPPNHDLTGLGGGGSNQHFHETYSPYQTTGYPPHSTHHFTQSGKG